GSRVTGHGGRASPRSQARHPSSRHPSPMRPPRFGKDRAAVVGAGSFGTAVAVLMVRAGLRTTLLCRTPEQAERLEADHCNEEYLPGVDLPERLRIRALTGADEQFHRADLVF